MENQEIKQQKSTQNAGEQVLPAVRREQADEIDLVELFYLMWGHLLQIIACVMVGGGAVISNASEELARFVEKLDAPVCDTLMGKGAFDGEKENYTGMIGMHGTKASNLAVTKCDLLVVIGARFSDRVTGDVKRFAPNAKILQIDIDPAEIDKNVKTTASVIGDVKDVLSILNRRLPDQHHPQWMETVKELKAKYPLTYRRDILTGPGVIEKIYEITGGDAIITTEVGQNQMWAAQFF